MPMPIHMTVTGETQGEMKGNCTMQGREGTILIDELDHRITMPTDPQNGQPSGKRLHGPMTIVKEVDQSSPLLFHALCTAERCEVVLKWYRQASGKEEHYYSTKLQQAVVVSLKTFIPNVYDASKSNYKHMEEVQFTYQKIICTHEVDGKECEDDWNAPAA